MTRKLCAIFFALCASFVSAKPQRLEYSNALSGDLYAPATPGRHPALVAVHGGGWFTGDASFYEHLGPYLAKHGYVLFAIDYRLGPKTYPAALEDVQAALRFLRAQPQVDPARVGLLGDSAGAQLAALAALKEPGVKACAALYGVYDMAAQWAHDRALSGEDNITENFLGATPAEAPQLFTEASPIAHATREHNSTAFLLAWGTSDEVVDPKTQSEAFALALSRAGFKVEQIPVAHAEHGWATEPIKPGSPAAFLAPRLLAFLRRQL